MSQRSRSRSSRSSSSCLILHSFHPFPSTLIQSLKREAVKRVCFHLLTYCPWPVTELSQLNRLVPHGSFSLLSSLSFGVDSGASAPTAATPATDTSCQRHSISVANCGQPHRLALLALFAFFSPLAHSGPVSGVCVRRQTTAQLPALIECITGICRTN